MGINIIYFKDELITLDRIDLKPRAGVFWRNIEICSLLRIMVGLGSMYSNYCQGEGRKLRCQVRDTPSAPEPGLSSDSVSSGARFEL